jgi:ADP-heptose:LPS heptosyltransferase
MTKHLIHYFAKELGLPESNKIPRLEIPRMPGVPYVTIHPKAGWSHYKNWPFEKWEEIIAAFPNTKFIQIGSLADQKLKGADLSHLGTPLMNAVKLISNAKLHLGVDSFSNHITHMSQTPAIILFGSTQELASGYPHHQKNISLGLECQPCFKEDPTISANPRGECINLVAGAHACMAGISVARVIKEIQNFPGIPACS